MKCHLKNSSETSQITNKNVQDHKSSDSKTKMIGTQFTMKPKEHKEKIIKNL